jgi:hypothetical protein
MMINLLHNSLSGMILQILRLDNLHGILIPCRLLHTPIYNRKVSRSQPIQYTVHPLHHNPLKTFQSLRPVLLHRLTTKIKCFLMVDTVFMGDLDASADRVVDGQHVEALQADDLEGHVVVAAL